jgi:hypothetical protein
MYVHSSPSFLYWSFRLNTGLTYALKEQSHKIFCLWFFTSNTSPWIPVSHCWVWLSGVNDADRTILKKPLWLQTYLSQNLSESEAIWFRAYQIPKLSDSEHVWFWTYLIPILSDSEPIWFRIFLILNWSAAILVTKQVNPIPPPPLPAHCDYQPVIARLVAKFRTKQVTPVHSFSLPAHDDY